MYIEDACGGTPPPPQQYASLACKSCLQYMQAGPGMAEVISIVKFTRVEFTMEITSAAGRTKLKKVWDWAETDAEIKRKHIRVTAETQQKRCPNPRKSLKMGSRGGPGADPSPGHGKSAKSGLDLVWIWLLFGYILRQLWMCFFMFFF